MTSLVDVFRRFSHLPGCLWLDSSVGGRFSFITADPIRRLSASPCDPDPWPELNQWCRDLPRIRHADTPPFQGGIAGMIGYEAATWLEPIGLTAENDLPTPAMSLGLYDWTIAHHHESGQTTLICNGLGDRHQDPVASATARANEIIKRLQSDGAVLDSRKHPRPVITRPLITRPAFTVANQHTTSRPDVHSNFSGTDFRESVADIVKRIRRGDSFQVNLAQRLIREADLPSPQLYLRLRQSNPAPFSAFYGGDGFEVMSSSPEGFLSVRDRVVQTRPIKGTAPRVGDARPDALLAHKLRASEKDRAENVMIVDLMRNDLSRVCEDESVIVRQLCGIETYQYVQHLVSVVEGKLRGDQTVVDLLAACFPGGSITGAPKIEAMRTIAELEPNPRGPYCGTIGYISTSGDADFNILIRTITAAHGYWQIPVGGGITARSDPRGEEAETWSKAEGMLRALPASTRYQESST